MPHIILLGTLDSKLEEFLYIYDRLTNPPFETKTPIRVTLIDCGRSPVEHDKITISQSELLSKYGPRNQTQAIADQPRGEVIKTMIQCSTACLKDLISRGDVHGIISAGGSGGTTLTATAMREAAPIGMPKIIASTVASGDTGPLVGETDITMMYSVVDIAGSNELLRTVLGNTAAAMIGMASAYEDSLKLQSSMAKSPKVRIGITMFGVTTPCVDSARQYLEETYPVEVFVFHATGHGGRAMERLVEEGRLDAVLDITTTEICDLLMGGVMNAGPSRLDAALKAGIPNVISLGATDMVNFGPKATVPEKYNSRKLYEHNPTVTLMRTTLDECRRMGVFIVGKIRTLVKDASKVEIRVPIGGVSMIAKPGGPFADEAADAELVATLENGLEGTGIKIVRDDRDVNDPGFAMDIAEQLARLLDLSKTS